MTHRPTRRVFGALLAAGVLVPAEAAEPDVDLALALAIDCSFSVDEREYRLQMEGLGAALMSPEVHEALASGPLGRISLAVYQWSDDNEQVTILPWTTLDSAESATALGRKLAGAPRLAKQGGTAISSALLYGATLLERAPPAARRVIDVSTDGRNNLGGPAPRARDVVVGRGITINGLAISNEWPTLDVYMENQVAGGPGNFVVKALSYDDFGAAMLKKLVREIAGPGLT